MITEAFIIFLQFSLIRVQVSQKKRGQPLTLTPNLHMNLPYNLTILSVVLWLLLIIDIE